jgi:hypothetical protein
MPKPEPLTPGERSLRARIGAYAKHGRNDSRETTTAARTAFLATFERQADPDGVLPPAERQRRAEQLRSAHFARLALAQPELVEPTDRRRREVTGQPAHPGRKRAERV